MTNLYPYLNEYQKARAYESTSEGIFFTLNQEQLQKSPLYQHLEIIRRPFDYLRANIVIKALENAKLLATLMTDLKRRQEFGEVFEEEKIRLEVEKCLKDRPYFLDKGIKIYLPLFSRGANLLLQKQFFAAAFLLEKTLHPLDNSDLIDPFEEYNFALYSSNFTSLIDLGGEKSAKAYYHADFMTIFFINDQGRLDQSLPLFDRRMKNYSLDRIIYRITPVVHAFFNGDRPLMIKSLFQNDLISTTAYLKLQEGR